MQNLPKNSFKYLFIFLSIISFANAYPQLQQVNYKILGISVEGNQTADATTVIANSGLKVGDEIEIPGDETGNAIKRLWGLNIFSDVQLEIDKKVGDGIFLLIKVKENQRIEKVLFKGNDEIDDDDLDEKVNFIRSQILKQQDIYRAKNRIKEAYTEKGYLNAEINPSVFIFAKADTGKKKITVTWRGKADKSQEEKTEYDYDKNSRLDLIEKIKDRVLLVYNIDEGDIIRVRKIDFHGNLSYDDGDLRSEISTDNPPWWKFWSSDKLKKEEYDEDKDKLRQFYRKNGYRDFEILKDTLVYSDDKKYVDVNFYVHEGPQYKVRDIIWEGNTVFPDDVLSARLGFEEGDIYNLEKFRQNLTFNEQQTDVGSLYQDNGYLNSNIIPREDKAGKDSVDLIIRIVENNRFKIGRVDITGNTKTKDKVIRRELYTIPGTYYSRSGVFRSLQQLAQLQYFNVEKLYQEGIQPQPVSDSSVTLTYKVEEKSSDYLNASVGYSGSFGMSGAVGVTLTNFSLASPFKMGGGQILNFNWQFGVGNFYRTFTIGFTEPWFRDTPTLLGFEVFDTRQRYIYDLRQSGGTIKVGRRLKWPDDFFNVQGRLRFQYNDVVDGRNYYQEGLSRQYTLGGTISRIDIDNPIFPSRGSKLSFNAELSGGPFLPGNVDYYKFNLTAEWYKRLFNSNRLALYLSTDLGYIDELVKGTTIQPFEFFYMGGNGMIIATTPLRGYDDRSVGPLTRDGLTTIGGRVMTKNTLELRAALALEPIPIYVLAFAEAGNVFIDLKNTDIFNLRRSVGFGARLLINPIGLIGFDYGYGFDRFEVDGVDPKWEFHFQFGRGF